MYLPQTVEYALRAMAYIANMPEGVAVRARDLSTATGVPAPYLSKLLRRMVVAGLLESQKGHGGGFTLAMPPRFVRFLDIMMAADFRPDPTHCAFGWGACKPAMPCPLHPTWNGLNEALCTWAANTTLANVIVPGGLPHPDSMPSHAELRSRIAEAASQAIAKTFDDHHKAPETLGIGRAVEASDAEGAA